MSLGAVQMRLVETQAPQEAEDQFCQNAWWHSDLAELDSYAEACGVKPYVRRAMARSYMNDRTKVNPDGMWETVKKGLEKMKDRETEQEKQERKARHEQFVRQQKHRVIFGNHFGVSEKMVKDFKKMMPATSYGLSVQLIRNFRLCTDLIPAIEFAKAEGLGGKDANRMIRNWEQTHSFEAKALQQLKGEARRNRGG